MNEEHKTFAKEISEMLTDMYNQGFADCEAAAKIAIEAGIKKAMSLEREACAKLCDDLAKEVGNKNFIAVDQRQFCAKQIRARGDK